MLGERLRVARRMAGLSQEQLARAAGVSKMAISKYERNLNMPGSDRVLRLARALGVGVDFLLRPVAVGISAAAFRCRDLPRLPARQQQALRAQLQEWLERYITAEEIVSERREFRFPEGLPRRVRSGEDVERAAQALREAWDLGSGPIENLFEELEERGIKVGTVKADGQVEAVLCFVGMDREEPVVAVSADRPGDRQRFSVAHELGHLMMDAGKDADRERLAQRFAGAFLAPAPAVELELGKQRRSLHLFELHLLKHKYGLSMQAWIHRAEHLGIVSGAAADRQLADFRTKGWRTREPGDQLPSEKPERLRRLVMRALAEGLVTQSRAAALLRTTIRGLRTEAAEEHGGFPAIAAPVRG